MRSIRTVLLALFVPLLVPIACDKREELPPGTAPEQRSVQIELKEPSLPPQFRSYPPDTDGLRPGDATLWRYRGQEIPGRLPWFLPGGPGVLVVEGRQIRAYQAEPEDLSEFRPGDARPIWTFDLPAYPTSTPLIDKDRIYWTLEGFGLVCISSQRGIEVWRLLQGDLDPRATALYHGDLLLSSETLGLGIVRGATGQLIEYEDSLAGTMEWVGPMIAFRSPLPGALGQLLAVRETQDSSGALTGLEADLVASDLVAAFAAPDGRSIVSLSWRLADRTVRAERRRIDSLASGEVIWETRLNSPTEWALLKPSLDSRVWPLLVRRSGSVDLGEPPSLYTGTGLPLDGLADLRVHPLDDTEADTDLGIFLSDAQARPLFQRLPDREYYDSRTFLVPFENGAFGLRRPNGFWIVAPRSGSEQTVPIQDGTEQAGFLEAGQGAREYTMGLDPGRELNISMPGSFLPLEFEVSIQEPGRYLVHIRSTRPDSAEVTISLGDATLVSSLQYSGTATDLELLVEAVGRYRVRVEWIGDGGPGNAVGLVITRG